MSYTGHKNPMMLDGKTLVEWITPTIEQESQMYNVPIPTPEQAALVISAIRMHTIIIQAADYDQSELGKPEERTTFWPVESSIGRFFRDAAQVTLDKYRLEDKDE